MTISEIAPATTFSMIVAHVIGQRIKAMGITFNEFYALTGISQASWSRMARGQTRFDIEDLRLIEEKTQISYIDVLETARAVEAKAESEGIKLIQPYTTQNKTDLAEAGVSIVAGAVLGFLALQVIKRS